MRKIAFILGVLLLTAQVYAQWKPAGDKIRTKWASLIDVDKVLPEYPRPIMERAEWKNLNGLWNFTVLPAGSDIPSDYDGKILVPFPVESSLSGAQKTVGDQSEIWYQKTFTIPSKWGSKNVLLHFEAVDWKADVFVNDVKIGTHTGAYAPFSFDITPYLTKSKEQRLVVKVWDPTDKGYQPRGKQVSVPKGIRYTSVSGIWQTVWLEPVANKYISKVKTTPDIDKSRLLVNVASVNTNKSDVVEIKILDGGNVIASAKAVSDESLELSIPDAKLWSPETPFLYDMEIVLYSKGKVADMVRSYAAMRKISYKRDRFGIMRMQLNNKDYFHFGTLDQGWWPDGLYTQPADEALVHDIRKTKEWGFNMIRKHVKVEPARWYTYCDRIGMLVWQDMPNPGPSPAPQWVRYDYFTGNEPDLTPEAEENFYKEWKEIIEHLYSHPCVVVWVPFNEGWGQFKTSEVAAWTKLQDPTRLVNSASGGNHFKAGDMLDIHNYPNPKMYIYDAERLNVLGEYGGIALALKGHLWNEMKNWGYVKFQNTQETTDAYVEYAKELLNLIKVGYSAAVYTQTTDVEEEVNGIMTYDRKVVKMDEEIIRKINQEICHSLSD